MQTEAKPKTVEAGTDQVIERLAIFKVISNAYLRSAIAWLPTLLVALLLVDWLIGRGVFAGDLFRLSGVVTIAIEFVILGLLFQRLPETLEILWQRRVIQFPEEPTHLQDEIVSFINSFEKLLNSRWAWVVGIACGLGGLGATYPARYFLQTGNSPFNFNGLLAYYLWGNAAFIAAPLGYLIGVLFWRVCVIAAFIGKLGGRFRIVPQPNHPDRTGGLKPLGDLCLTMALLLLVPAIYLSVWGFAATFIKTGGELYTQLWSGLFRQWLILLSLLALFSFLQPLYNVHLQMQKRRREIIAELTVLTQRIEELSEELRTKAHTFAPKDGEEKLEDLAFMKKVYLENSQIPIWPIEWQTFLKFLSAQAVPILSLIGTSEPVTSLVASILSSTTK
jgi:hypothetical protein